MDYCIYYFHIMQLLEIKMVVKNDIGRFLETVQWALSERYKMTFSIDEIKHELHMPITNRIKISIKR